MLAYHSFSKAKTRYGLVDPQLTKRGWNLADRSLVSLEVLVDSYKALLVNGNIYFLKCIVKLADVLHCADLVKKAFDAFILEHNYNADQTHFLRTVQTITMQKRKIEVGDLYEPPVANFGLNAVEKLFSESKVEEILELTKSLVI